jgi:hypothetical protein
MSDTQTEERPADIEARARLMGWRPLEEFRGPAGAWKSAEEFVRRGEEDLPLVREHNRKLEARLLKVDADLADLRESSTYLADMSRTAAENAYKRGKAEAEAQRRAAVAAGDIASFDAAEAQIQALEAEKPKPLPKPTPAPAAQATIDPDAAAWAQRETWFNTDPVLKQAAIRLHGQLMQDEPGLTMTQNLERVSSGIRAMYPGKFANDTPPDDAEPAENPRRSQPGPVSRSSAPSGPSRPKPRSFDAMPDDSKKAYEKFARQIGAKAGAKPLTKEEWAENYWEGQ